MMKRFKKMAGVLLAAVMCAGMCLTGFAANTTSDFSITVENSAVDKTYSAYKIFDALYNGDAVTYSVDADSPWYSTLSGDESVFNFTRYTKEDETEAYYVTVKENVEDSAVIAAIENAFALIGENNLRAAVTDSGNGGELVLDPGEAGYYYVTTTSGSIVSITTAAPDATIVDKNLTPGELSKGIVSGDETVKSEVGGMGDEVTFDITAYVPLYAGDKVVTEYVFTDTLSNGLLIELTEGQFTSDNGHYYLSEGLINEWVTLGEDDTKSFTDQVYDYTFELIGCDIYTDEITGDTVHTFSGFVLTYYTYDTGTYVDGDEDTFDTSKYPANADIEIKYTAHVSSLEGYDNTNDIEMAWFVTSWDHPTPEEPEPGTGAEDHDHVYSWELELVKVDGIDKTPLEGAAFTLESENMKSVAIGHSYAYVTVSELESASNGKVTVNGEEYEAADFETTDYYKKSDGSFGLAETNDGPYHRILTDKQIIDVESDYVAKGTTDESGKIYFAGLGTGTYILTEITAPNGYNILTDPIKFTIDWAPESGFTVTRNPNGEEENLADGYIFSFSIENNAGTLLPSTGGMGTTIFYIAGVLLMIFGAAAFVAKRRIDRQN